MKLIDFHTMRRAVQDNASPASGEELRVVVDRVRETLLASGVFEDVEVESTGDADQLVIAMCRFSAPLTEEVAERSLEWLWENELRFGFWASHGTLVEPGQVEFEGATRASTWGRYVTVHIIAQTVAVPAQRGPEVMQSADVVGADL